MLILASQSPRRRELMRYITSDFQVIPSQAEEAFSPEEKTALAALSPEDTVLRLSQVKAREVARAHPLDMVIGADTVVAAEGQLLEKPRDEADAFRMLRLLSGREHLVCTGVTLVRGGWEESFAERSMVRFFPLTDEEIRQYIATGEPFGKAGGYGIQGLGCLLVEGIQGDFYNIVGLPVARLRRALDRAEKEGLKCLRS